MYFNNSPTLKGDIYARTISTKDCTMCVLKV